MPLQRPWVVHSVTRNESARVRYVTWRSPNGLRGAVLTVLSEHDAGETEIGRGRSGGHKAWAAQLRRCADEPVVAGPERVRGSRPRTASGGCVKPGVSADSPCQSAARLISNALVHRDLAEWSTLRSIECRLTPDTFRLTNPGGLYGITADRLGVHPLTSARNRRLVDICKFIRTNDGNVVEALASGIPAAMAAVREAGMPDLEFYDQGITFTVTIRREAALRIPVPAGTSRRIGNDRSELLDL